jgi:AAA+ superfamily predicted ATPase
VKLFDLDRHCFVRAHVDQVKDYVWDTNLGDKLILPHSHKEVIQILMETAKDQIDDIIRGKSGGTICICTGEPGTGKTLTAEVTSEVIKSPLYKVNCSQLGTNEEEIEKELSRVLSRASRWQALLLIDEADVYVRARENDIQQNAIVGVFLRVLEYYRGILFLTSNRADGD